MCNLPLRNGIYPLMNFASTRPHPVPRALSMSQEQVETVKTPTPEPQEAETRKVCVLIKTHLLCNSSVQSVISDLIWSCHSRWYRCIVTWSLMKKLLKPMWVCLSLVHMLFKDSSRAIFISDSGVRMGLCSLCLWWCVLIVNIDNADYYTHVKGYNMATSVESVANELISAVFTAHSFLETGW